jgi:hypothetical protein
LPPISELENVSSEPGKLTESERTMSSKDSSYLSRFWEGWKRVARKIGDVQARIILTVFYIFIVGPFALVIRCFGDPLAIKRGAPKGWRQRSADGPVSLQRACQQF